MRPVRPTRRRFGAWLEVELAGHSRRGPRSASSRPTPSPTVRGAPGIDVDRDRTSASGAPTTTSPPSSTSCRSRSARRGAWVHYGLTSSDVVDTALALQLTRAGRSPARRGRGARCRDRERGAAEFRDTPMVGRTHGIHAEPTTFGAKLALWAMQVRRDRERLRARPRRHRGRQALGRGRHVLATSTPRSRRYVCEHARPHSRSPPPRCSPATATPRSSTRARRSARPSSRSRLEIRHLQRTEVREAEEPFRAGGRRARARCRTSATRSSREQLCGLARVLRGNLQPALENVALWHERDISHSSVERIILPDSLHARLLRARAVSRRSSRACGAPRAHAARTSTRRSGCVQPAGAARAGRGGPDRATTPTASCSATRCARGSEERPFRDAARAPTPRCARRSTPRASTRASTSTASLANVGRIVRRARACARSRPMSTLDDLPHLYRQGPRALRSRRRPLLMVASDRISVFDVVLPDPIPDKGRVLTGVSLLVRPDADIVPNHVSRRDPTDFPETARAPTSPGGRCSCARPEPCRSSASCAATCSAPAGGVPGDRHGRRASRCRPGLRQAERLPEPLFTPPTKAERAATTCPSPRPRRAELVGGRRATSELQELSLALYERRRPSTRAGARLDPRRHQVRVRRSTRRRADR